jgi:predicted TIM-barrel fold metal-dependent hydrolase
MIPFRSVGEVEFVQGAAAMAASGLYGEGIRCCAGIVGFANLTLGDAVEPVLRALMAAGANFRGIRHAHGWHPSPDINNSHHGDIEGLLGREDFRAGFTWLDKLGLTFDCWGFHTQLGEVGDLAAAFPGVTIVMNHIGGPR